MQKFLIKKKKEKKVGHLIINITEKLLNGPKICFILIKIYIQLFLLLTWVNMTQTVLHRFYEIRPLRFAVQTILNHIF